MIRLWREGWALGRALQANSPDAAMGARLGMYSYDLDAWEWAVYKAGVAAGLKAHGQEG